MHSRMKYSLITILSVIVNVSLFCALPPPQGLHRREADNHVHEAATSLLLSQYATLESVLKENTCSILEISNANLTNSTLLQTALNTTCMMKDILDTLATAEVAVMGQDSEEDVEISAVKILVRRIYLESCEMMVQEAQQHGSLWTTESSCLPQTYSESGNQTTTSNYTSEAMNETTSTSQPTDATNTITSDYISGNTTNTTITIDDTTSVIINDLCNYWQALQLAEATKSDLTILLTLLRNE